MKMKNRVNFLNTVIKNLNTDDDAISKTNPRDNEDPIQKARGEYKNHCSDLRINRYIMNNNISLILSY